MACKTDNTLWKARRIVQCSVHNAVFLTQVFYRSTQLAAETPPNRDGMAFPAGCKLPAAPVLLLLLPAVPAALL
jgi:hypothetical protein